MISVTPRLLAILSGVLAIPRRLLTITPRSRAVARRTSAARSTPATQFLHPQRVPVGEIVARVEVCGFLVANLSYQVAHSRRFVAHLRENVSLLGRSIAQA